MAVIIDGGSGALDEITQTWVDAGKTAVPNGSNLVDANDLGTAAYVDTIDEDDMASDSAAKVPTQQSVKAYVDANAGGASDVGDLTTAGLTAANMLRVAAAGGLEERTPAQVLSDIGAAASSHTHDDSEITAAASAVNYTPAAATVEGHLSGIDTALGSVGGGGTWGSITGTLSDQTDLQTALNAKAAIAGQTFTDNVLVSKAASATLGATSSSGFAYLNLNGASAVQGFGTSTLQIGEGFSTVQIRKPFSASIDDTVNNGIIYALTAVHTTSGTPANGMAVGVLLQVESSAATRSIGVLSAGYINVTDASRTTYLRGEAIDSAGTRTIWEGRADGTAGRFAVLGATPALRQAHIADPSGGGTVDAEARTAINSILNVLETFGFVATS